MERQGLQETQALLASRAGRAIQEIQALQALQGLLVLRLLKLAQPVHKDPRVLQVEVVVEERAIRGRRVQQEQLQIPALQAQQVV